MARDLLAQFQSSTTSTGTATSSTLDTLEGTPKRGLPVVWNYQHYGSSGQTAQVTVQASDDQTTWITAGTFNAVTATTATTSAATALVGQQTIQVSVTQRYLRAINTLAGTSPTCIWDSGVVTSNPA